MTIIHLLIFNLLEKSLRRWRSWPRRTARSVCGSTWSVSSSSGRIPTTPTSVLPVGPVSPETCCPHSIS